MRKHRRSRGQAKLFEETPMCVELPPNARREIVSALAELLLDAALGDQRNQKEVDRDESESDS
jgi:hypothetical protein